MALNRNPPLDRKPVFVYRESVGPLRVYLDDLENFVRFLRNNSNTVVIGAGRATADEPIDLRSATPKELQELSIRTETLEVLLRKDHASVATGEDAEEAISLVRSAAAVLRNSEGGNAPAWWGTQLSGLLGWFIVAAAILQLVRNDPGWLVASILLLGLGLLIALGVPRLQWKAIKQNGRATINLHTRAEAMAARSSSRIVVTSTIIGAAIGSVLTLVGTWLTP